MDGSDDDDEDGEAQMKVGTTSEVVEDEDVEGTTEVKEDVQGVAEVGKVVEETQKLNL